MRSDGKRPRGRSSCGAWNGADAVRRSWRCGRGGRVYREKNVIECNCVTGDYSMLLEVLFENTMELDRFIGELQYFGRTKTLIVFSTSVEHRGVEL